MILYVRQEAYYHATPDKQKISRAESIEAAREAADNAAFKTEDTLKDIDIETEELSNNISMVELQEIPMPKLIAGSEYLVAFLHSAGTASATGNGLVGLSWQELEAWERSTDNVGIVTPQDRTIISMLSKVYARESYLATQKDARPPYIPAIEDVVSVEVAREHMSNKLDNFFASLIAKQKKD